MAQSPPIDKASLSPVAPRVLWLFMGGVAGAVAGWFGASYLGLSSLLVCILGGVCLATGYQAVRWLCNPGRREDGSLHLRSLAAVMVSSGMLGGAFLGLGGWSLGVLLYGPVTDLSRGWAGEWTRAALGCVVGALVGWLAGRFFGRRPPSGAQAARLPEEPGGGRTNRCS